MNPPLGSSEAHEPARPLDLASLGPVLVVAPHPDDETLGCGGLIAACARRRQPVTVAVLTDGAASHPRSRMWPPARLAALRSRELSQAMAVLGLPQASVHQLGVPDGGAHALDAEARSQLLMSLTRLVAAHRSVFVCAPEDDHPDHRAAAQLTQHAVAAAPGRALYYYSIWPQAQPPTHGAPSQPPTTSGRPRHRLDIAQDIETKERAIQCYASQLGRVVEDDPDGFVMPPALLARASSAWEWFERHRPSI